MVTYPYLVTFSLGCRDVSRRTRILLAAVFTDFESHHWRCTYGNTRAALFFTEMFLGVGALDKDVSWVSPRHKMGYCMQSACSVRLGKARTAAAISTTSSVYYLRPRTESDTMVGHSTSNKKVEYVYSKSRSNRTDSHDEGEEHCSSILC